MSQIAVVTALAKLGELVEPVREDDVECIAFVESERPSAIWQQRPLVRLFDTSARNCAMAKILVGQFIAYDYSIWISPGIRLKVAPTVLVERWLAKHDVAVFQRENWSDSASYAQVTSARRLDEPYRVMDQYLAYARGGLPEDFAMIDSRVVLRRHSTAVDVFNALWWSEYCRHSILDELSLTWVSYRSGSLVNILPPLVAHSELFEFSETQALPLSIHPKS